jgi:hypothetical protein
MSPSLRERVAQTALQAERLRWIYAALLWSMGAAGVLVLAGVLDALWRGQDVGTRLLLSLAVAASLAALGWRFFRPLAAPRVPLLDVARRIDAFYPELDHRLASALAFHAQSEQDPLAGSVELRRHVVAQTESRAARLDFRAVLDERPVRRAARSAAAVFAAVALLVALAPRTSATALTRLAMPLAPVEWPRQYRLEWKEAPTHVARGQDARLVLGGRLPDTVELQLQFQEGGPIERRALRPIDGRVTYSLENVSEPLRYRASGGDDDTLPWLALEVVEPPLLERLDATVIAPAYTGWPVQQGGRLTRLLAGSQVSIAGQFDRPIRAARLVADNTPDASIVGSVAGDGLSFRIPGAGESPFLPRESGHWRLEIEDERQVVTRRAEELEFRVLADEPPRITWAAPADNSYLTPEATLRIRGAVADDLGIATIDLQRSSVEGEKAQPASETLDRNEPREHQAKSLDEMAAGVRQTLDYRWKILESVPDLQPGQVLVINLAASDRLPQTTVTPSRRLLVISSAEYQERAQQRQRALLTQLAETVKLAHSARAPLRAVESRWAAAQAADPSDAAQLQHAEFSQRQVQHALSDPASGTHAQAAQLLEDLEDNQLGELGLARRLKELRAVTGPAIEQLLPQVAQGLGAVLKDLRMRAANAETPPPLDSLRAAGKAQEQAIDSLESILARLNEWDTLARLASDVRQVQQEQQQMRDQTEALRLKMAAASAAEMPAQIAESKQLSQQQFDLTRQFDRVAIRVQELHRRLETESGENAATMDLLADALDVARRTGVSGHMQEAGRSLAAERPGKATPAQAAALEGLTAMLEAFSGRADQELKQRIEQLEAAATRLTELLARQDRERQAADRAAAEGNAQEQRRQLSRVGRSEQRLAAEIQQWIDQIQRLRAPSAVSAAEQAGKELSAAASAGARGAAQETQQAAREASRLLEGTKRALHAALEQAQADLVQEEMSRLEEQVASLERRQETLANETARLESLRRQTGQWQRAQLAALQNSARAQRGLAEAATTLAADLQSPAFAASLRGAGQEMERAAAGLERNDAGDASQQAQQAALHRLKQLRQILAEPPPENNRQSQAPEGSENENADQPPNVQSVNELKLLLLLQQELNRRTSELDARRNKAGELTPEISRQIADLAAEQGEVAEIVQKLLARSPADKAPGTALPDQVPPPENGD